MVRQQTGSSKELLKSMTRWRRDLHTYAEPGWLEFRTASIVADELEALGYELQLGKEVIDGESRMGVPSAEVLARHEQRAMDEGANKKWMSYFTGGYTGVVGIIRTKNPGPTVGIRFDMDALHINESADIDHVPTKENFASVHPGEMHACGHDAHTSIGLAVANYIADHQEILSGTYKLIFQPAEEGVRGAKSMVAAGVVDDVDIFLASHVGINVDLGTVVSGIDNFLATTKFNVLFEGKASHAGGFPEEGKNALLAASSAVLNLHSIPRSGKGQSQINVGKLSSGYDRNIIPAFAEMQVETRGETTEINTYMVAKAMNIIKGAAQMYGINYQVDIVGEANTSRSSKPLKNYIRKALTGLPVIDHVLDSAPFPIGSEDATYMMNKVQENGGTSTYMIFGTELAAGHHHEKFDIDEKVLEIALASYMEIIGGIAEYDMNK